MLEIAKESPESDDSPLWGSSLDAIIKHALEFEGKVTLDNNEEIENVPMLYHLLGYMWQSLTDSSLYISMKSQEDHPIPFMHSQKTQELIAERIIKHYNEFKDGFTSQTNEEFNESTLKNIMQGHLLTCMKIITTFIMSTKGPDYELSNVTIALLNVIEVLMKLVPLCVELATMLDFFTDVIKPLPHNSIAHVVEFAYTRSFFFRQNFVALEATSGAKALQTCGAKMIAMIKAFETNLSDNGNIEAPILIFNLRTMLTTCLPIWHLGVCNRQSLAYPSPPLKCAPQSEWNRLETILSHEDCYGLTPHEINVYESIAAATCSAKLCHAGDINQMHHPKVEIKQSSGDITRFSSYGLYVHYCDFANFALNADSIVERNQEYVQELQKSVEVIASHTSALLERGVSEEECQNIIAPQGDYCEFLSNFNNVSFWVGVVLSGILAIGSLKTSHKRGAPQDTVYSKLRERTVEILDSIYKTLWQIVSKSHDLAGILDGVVEREKQWILWKQAGCTDAFLQAPTEDTLSNNVIHLDNLRLEATKDFYQKFSGDMYEFITNLANLERHCGDTENFGSNLTIDINSVKLDRQRQSWYLEQPESDPNEPDELSLKLLHKLDDCMKKLQMDDDPANGIEEQHKSIHDPMFRFRFARLFSLYHMEKFMELGNYEIASGNIQYLAKVLSSTQETKKPVETEAAAS